MAKSRVDDVTLSPTSPGNIADKNDDEPGMNTSGLIEKGLPDSSKSTSTANSTPPKGDDKSQRDVKDTFKKLTGIEQAKDRAQITSATAMSIVHVALLKNVLDAGSEGDKYYSCRVGVISAALVLQIIAGVIALYVALLRGYYTEYKNDFLNDCFKTCCPCRIRRKTRKLGKSTWKGSDSFDALQKQIKSGHTDCEDPGCCPFECTTDSYAPFENEMLDLYDNMKEEEIRTRIQTVGFDDNIIWLKNKVETLKKEIAEYESLDVSDETSNAEYIAKIKKQKDEAWAKAQQMEVEKRNSKMLQIQGKVLEEHVEGIYQQRVLKRVTFWQNILNLIFYTVFVLNAIIAGIGLADPIHAVAADAGKGDTAAVTVQSASS